jgi:hypothetical protein
VYFFFRSFGKKGIWTFCFSNIKSCSICESIAVSEVSVAWLSANAVSTGCKIMPLVLVSLLLDDPYCSLNYIFIYVSWMGTLGVIIYDYLVVSFAGC